MRILRIFLFVLISFLATNCNAQFSVQSNIGIENPYKYVYHFNVTPKSLESTFEEQKFRFLRTKIISIGGVYNYSFPFLKKRFSIDVGANMGYMHQFVADTIVRPTQVGLIYNARHKNIFFAPEIGLNFKVYKFISLTTGIEGFIPIRKWIHSEQELLVFKSEYSRNFYSSNIYYSIGLEFDVDILKLGFKFQSSGEVDHWIRLYPFVSVYIDHDLQRWMVYVKYDL